MWKKDVVMRFSIKVYVWVQKFYFFNFEMCYREMIRQKIYYCIRYKLYDIDIWYC